MSDLKGKNAVITGASRGIGKAVAMRLAENGVNVLIAARTQSTLDETVAEIKKKTGVKAIGLATDVSKLEDLQRLADLALKEFKAVYILVNNAGVSSQ